MSTYEELYADGERARMANQPLAALGPYKGALGIGGLLDRQIKQMIGVCYRMLCNYTEAITWYQRALEDKPTTFESSNILRDMGEAYSKLGDYTAANVLLLEALSKVSYTQHPEHFAITLGYKARNEQRMGNLAAAIKHYAVANSILFHEDNRYFELYNLLPYANAVSATGHWFSCRVAAFRALLLTRTYGARPHRIRALVLFIGGHKLDDYVQNRWPPK